MQLINFGFEFDSWKKLIWKFVVLQHPLEKYFHHVTQTFLCRRKDFSNSNTYSECVGILFFQPQVTLLRVAETSFLQGNNTSIKRTVSPTKGIRVTWWKYCSSWCCNTTEHWLAVATTVPKFSNLPCSWREFQAKIDDHNST